MNVYLSFDTEVWCNDWSALDARFPSSFERYYRGRSKHGDYALPKTLEILNQHQLVGVFFVEPLFSARFGSEHLRAVTDPIAAAGQDIQLHVHAEWTDEIRPALLADVSSKRQHLTLYSQDEQATLLAHARGLLEAATGRPINAFRAGSFAANRDTYCALRRCGIHIDSSLNALNDFAGGSLGDLSHHSPCRIVEGVAVYPVTVFTDGLGRLRPAQVGACGFAELRAAMLQAQARGEQHFVIVSHNFEMLKPGSIQPDWVVVRRFEQLCQFLAANRDLFQVGPYPETAMQPLPADPPRLSVPWLPTLARVAAQLRRRIG